MGVNEPMSWSTEQLSTLKEQGFDYLSLSSSTRMIVQQHTQEIKKLMKRTAQDIIYIGHKLLEVKEKLGHGHFESWLKAEFGWSLSAGRKFMQVTRRFKSVNFTDLFVDASALYLLAAPSTPEAVFQKALERATQGEVITYTKVKEIVSQSKDKELDKLQAFKTTELSIIGVASKTEESRAFISAESLPAAEIVDAESAPLVEHSEDKLPKKTETPAQLQGSNRSHDMTPATDRGDNPPKDEPDTGTRSLFNIGSIIYLTGFRQQDYKLLGEIVEVKKEASTHIEVLIKISLQP